jgi:methylglutaconyl-CoA hydratase
MKTVRVEQQGNIARITLNRPDVRNAFDATMIKELREAFDALPDNARIVVLTGSGSAFCAGADLEWMQASAAMSEKENAADAAQMARLFSVIDETERVVIGRINGPALGGGLGLVACCDVAIAVDTVKFGFSEVRLGLVPAVISPFVVAKMGVSASRRYFVTGELFGAHQALADGLVHKVVGPERLDDAVNHMLELVEKNGPRAMGEAKKLVRVVSARPRVEALSYAVETIARLRVSPEGQEGVKAFLEKRKPSWP